MSWLPLSFGLPAVLWGLLALPVIWWLLRLTPPRPQQEIFPPLRILARVFKREETPYQSPWWLTLLRLLMAALVILSLAEPVFNPRERVHTGGEGIAIVMDNGWSSATDWDRRVATAERLIADAASTGAPVLLAFTAEKPNADIGPFDAAAARNRLRAAEPRPIPTDRPAVYSRVADAMKAMPGASVAVLADGLAQPSDQSRFHHAFRQPAEGSDLGGSRPAGHGRPNRDRKRRRRLQPHRHSRPGRSSAAPGYRRRLRRQGPTHCGRGADFRCRRNDRYALVNVPFELRNDFSSVALDGEPQAAAVRVLDESAKRRRVGLISQSEADQAQPLLSPLYYIRSALEPFADLVEASNPDLAVSIPELINRKPAMIVMADVGTIPCRRMQNSSIG